tara:strand:+ start:533 stop:664 length:132 start_codon:yes stop_codon:yes gene_type:complete
MNTKFMSVENKLNILKAYDIKKFKVPTKNIITTKNIDHGKKES